MKEDRLQVHDTLDEVTGPTVGENDLRDISNEDRNVINTAEDVSTVKDRNTEDRLRDPLVGVTHMTIGVAAAEDGFRTILNEDRNGVNVAKDNLAWTEGEYDAWDISCPGSPGLLSMAIGSVREGLEVVVNEVGFALDLIAGRD